MSADQIAEIAPGVREAIAGGDDLCVTFTISGDEDRWVQFVGGVVNAAWPHAHDPEPLIAQLGHAAVESYQAEQYVTARLRVADVYAVARWIDAYFEHALGAGTDYSLDLEIERL
jgi:hypothetical protein